MRHPFQVACEARRNECENRVRNVGGVSSHSLQKKMPAGIVRKAGVTVGECYRRPENGQVPPFIIRKRAPRSCEVIRTVWRPKGSD